MCLLSSYFSKTSRSSKMVSVKHNFTVSIYSCLYHVYVFSPANLLKSCLMFGIWLSMPGLFFAFSPVQCYKIYFLPSPLNLQLMFHGWCSLDSLRSSFISFLLIMFKKQGMCWPVDVRVKWSCDSVYHRPLYVSFSMQLWIWSCTKIKQKWSIVLLLVSIDGCN